jgi:hypothetical protein
VPLFSPLKPHGSGVLLFLDGWGFAKEDKVLYLTIVKARYLNAMDLSSSDPYCEIHCNGMMLQSRYTNAYILMHIYSYSYTHTLIHSYTHILIYSYTHTHTHTSVKWQNLNPDYHEAFEIDVTNPGATLNVVVKDKDYFGSDDFMGQVHTHAYCIYTHIHILIYIYSYTHILIHSYTHTLILIYSYSYTHTHTLIH